MAVFQSEFAQTQAMVHHGDWLSLADAEASLRNMLPDLHSLIDRARAAADAADAAEKASDRRLNINPTGPLLTRLLATGAALPNGDPGGHDKFDPQ
jgi:hypothetical protein